MPSGSKSVASKQHLQPKTYKPSEFAPTKQEIKTRSWACCECARVNPIEDKDKRKFVDPRHGSPLRISGAQNNYVEQLKCIDDKCGHRRCKDCFDLDSDAAIISRASGEPVDEEEYESWVDYMTTARLTWDGK